MAGFTIYQFLIIALFAIFFSLLGYKVAIWKNNRKSAKITTTNTQNLPAEEALNEIRKFIDDITFNKSDKTKEQRNGKI